MKRLVAIVLMLIMLLSVFVTGCSKSEEATEAPSETEATVSSEETAEAVEEEEVLEEVKLTMYLLGDKPADFDMVYDEVNKLLKEDINATLEVSFLSWGEFSDRYPLLFSSGESFDLIYTSNWAFYSQMAVKDAFLEITDEMLAEYAPMTLENTSEMRFEQAKINGKLYMLPYTKKEFAYMTYVVRGDLMDKYGIEQVTTPEEFGAYLSAVSAEEGLIPYDDGSDFNRWGMAEIALNYPNTWSKPLQSTPFSFDYTDMDNIGFVNTFKDPQYLEFLYEMREWNEAGYWSKDAIVNETSVKDSFLNGKSASAIVNAGDANSIYMQCLENHPDWDVRIFDAVMGNATIANPSIQNGMAVNAMSENPERAIMLLDLFKNDQRYYDLTNYGIEGTHWINTGDLAFETADAFENYPPVAACPWGWMSTEFEKGATNAAPNYRDILATWDETLTTHPLQLFNFDNSNVKNEAAAVKSVIDEYQYALQLGYFEDVEGKYNEFMDALEKAGINEIEAEIAAQVEAFMAGQ